MTEYELTWAAYGTNGRLNQYRAGASDWSEQYGCWGLSERIADTTSTKLAGLDAAHAAPRPPNALGLPVPTTGLPAGYFSGCNAANASAAGPLGIHNGSTVFYPVNLLGLQVGPDKVARRDCRDKLEVAYHSTFPHHQAGAVLEVSIGGALSTNLFELGLNGDTARFGTTTVPGSVSFRLSADDIGGTFGGAAALRLRSLTPGAYTVIDTVGLEIVADNHLTI